MARRTTLLGLVVLAAACGGGASYDDAAVHDAPVRDGDTSADAAAADAAAADAAPADAGPAVLEVASDFAPAVGSLCGVGFDPATDRVWLYPCSGAELLAFTADGTPAGSLARPGEAANDVDIDVAPVGLTLGTAAVASGAVLFVNGETGVAEVHAPDTAGSPVLATEFGASHVVGGAYHAGRSTLFLVQDQVAGVPDGNRIAEVDPVTGAVLGSFETTPAFVINYGDLAVCQASGHLFVVSSDETTIAELSATGTLLAEHVLPAGVTAVSGIGLTGDGAAWLVGTGGGVWQLSGVPCGTPGAAP